MEIHNGRKCNYYLELDNISDTVQVPHHKNDVQSRWRFCLLLIEHPVNSKFAIHHISLITCTSSQVPSLFLPKHLLFHHYNRSPVDHILTVIPFQFVYKVPSICITRNNNNYLFPSICHHYSILCWKNSCILIILKTC